MKEVAVKNKKRIDWIDTLRGLAMFFVVWGHLFPTNKWKIRKYIYSFHMPMFFFISGLTFNKSDELPFKEFIKKKAKNLLIPYLCMNIFCIIINFLLYQFNITETFSLLESITGIFYSHDEVFNIPCGASWFVTTLFLTEILFYGMKKIAKDDYQLFLGISILGIIGYVNGLSKHQIYGPWHIESVFTGVVFYFVGYLLMKNIKILEPVFKEKRRMFFYGGILGIVGIAGALINRNASMNANLHGSVVLFYISAFATILGLLFFVKLCLNKSYVFKKVGAYTWFYVGYHQTAVIFIDKFIPQAMSNNISVLVSSCILFVILLPLAMFTNKYLPILIGKTKKS